MLISLSRYKILFHLYNIGCNFNALIHTKKSSFLCIWDLSTNDQISGIFIIRSTHFIFPYHSILLPPAKHFPHWQLVLCRAFIECDEIIFSCIFLQNDIPKFAIIHHLFIHYLNITIDIYNYGDISKNVKI